MSWRTDHQSYSPSSPRHSRRSDLVQAPSRYPNTSDDYDDVELHPFDAMRRTLWHMDQMINSMRGFHSAISSSPFERSFDMLQSFSRPMPALLHDDFGANTDTYQTRERTRSVEIRPDRRTGAVFAQQVIMVHGSQGPVYESRSRYEDARGVRRSAVERGVANQAARMVRRREGPQESVIDETHYYNIRPGEQTDFDDKWRQAARPLISSHRQHLALQDASRGRDMFERKTVV
eukprot:TRINITY_DN7332_c0_g1_i5.p1 TRINITY_DN7332_c0_g1~~TRINITY_DN7332_c0_g1_i5.p1  ORF type:complete len:233 (+),score=17.96 TRINITY_DN7332_c0_g1_i5:53-751(+)